MHMKTNDQAIQVLLNLTLINKIVKSGYSEVY